MLSLKTNTILDLCRCATFWTTDTCACNSTQHNFKTEKQLQAREIWKETQLVEKGLGRITITLLLCSELSSPMTVFALKMDIGSLLCGCSILFMFWEMYCLRQVREEATVLTERVHELIASRWPAGTISNWVPIAVLLGRGRVSRFILPTARAFITTPRRAFWIGGAAATTATHLLNNFHLSSQL